MKPAVTWEHQHCKIFYLTKLREELSNFTLQGLWDREVFMFKWFRYDRVEFSRSEVDVWKCGSLVILHLVVALINLANEEFGGAVGAVIA